MTRSTRPAAHQVLWALLPLAFATTAVAGAPPTSGRFAEDEQGERALKRILTLEGGATLRAIARQQGGDWEIKQNGRWVRAPWPVTDVRLEREVFSEYRSLAARIDDGAAPVQRCELADWMLRNGLLAEALAELDPLVSGSDAPCVRRTLERHAFRFAIPNVAPVDARSTPREALEPLFSFACRATPALQELCAQRALGLEDGPALAAVLAEDLVSSSVRRRAWSAFALGRLFPGEQLTPLLQRAVLDASDDVRARAQHALRVAGEPALALPVLRALETSPVPRVRIQAAEALGNMGYVAAVPRLIARMATLEGATRSSVPHGHIFVGRQFAYLQDFDVEVAQGQAVADPNVNVLMEGAVLDAGVVSSRRVEFTVERQTLRRSLELLSGARPGRRSADWSAWWEAEGQAVLSRPR